MRSSKSYKRPYPNQAVIQLFEKSFVRYFDYNLVERFLKFKAEFEKIYNDY
jgi:response regulator RpfG family c-di-GMP phosphodiesterase